MNAVPAISPIPSPTALKIASSALTSGSSKLRTRVISGPMTGILILLRGPFICLMAGAASLTAFAPFSPINLLRKGLTFPFTAVATSLPLDTPVLIISFPFVTLVVSTFLPFVIIGAAFLPACLNPNLASNTLFVTSFPTLVREALCTSFATGVTNDFLKNLPPVLNAPFNFLAGADLFNQDRKLLMAPGARLIPSAIALARSFILLSAAAPKSKRASPTLLKAVLIRLPPVFNMALKVLKNNLNPPFKILKGAFIAPTINPFTSFRPLRNPLRPNLNP